MQIGDYFISKNSDDGLTVKTILKSDGQFEFSIMSESSDHSRSHSENGEQKQSDSEFFSDIGEEIDRGSSVTSVVTSPTVAQKPKSKGDIWTKFKNPAQLEKDRVTTLFFLSRPSFKTMYSHDCV